MFLKNPITRHQYSGTDRSTIKIIPASKIGPGGAPHRYDIIGFDTKNNDFNISDEGYSSNYSLLPIVFQTGMLKDKGHNGVTLESLLAIVEDQLSHFQKGSHSCDENAEALEYVGKALDALHARRFKRVQARLKGEIG